MCRLIETLRLSKDGVDNIAFHNRRLNEARKTLFDAADRLDLSSLEFPRVSGEEKIKCRIVYGEAIESVEFSSYTPRQIFRLRLVEDNRIDYGFKYEERGRLMALWGSRGDADDVLIVKQGRITDTSFANVALYDGKNWVTPAFPLLRGTRRAALLELGIIREDDILASDLGNFTSIRLFNSMIRFEDAPSLSIHALAVLSS